MIWKKEKEYKKGVIDTSTQLAQLCCVHLLRPSANSASASQLHTTPSIEIADAPVSILMIWPDVPVCLIALKE